MIFFSSIGILAGMFRFVVVVFSIVWASLLLLSWSSAEPPSPDPLHPQAVQASIRN